MKIVTVTIIATAMKVASAEEKVLNDFEKVWLVRWLLLSLFTPYWATSHTPYLENEMKGHQVKTGESLWIIEQTDQVGIRKFWAGDLWTDNVMEAVRFPSHSAASVLACHYAWSNFGNPPRKNELVDICEHLFQCGIEDSDVSDFEQQRDAALKLAQSWLNALYLLPPDSPGKPYTGTAYRKCAKELRAIFSQKEEK